MRHACQTCVTCAFVTFAAGGYCTCTLVVNSAYFCFSVPLAMKIMDRPSKTYIEACQTLFCKLRGMVCETNAPPR